jgi:pimeloyl-ACP methyl ester carboxylesterase
MLRSISTCSVSLLLLAGCSSPRASPAPSSAPTEEIPMSAATTSTEHALQAERRGEGLPLVLIGGGLTGWLSWDSHATRLASTREVVRLQLLSVQYGLEQRPLPAEYSVRLESRAVRVSLDELGWLEPVDMVAWSFGALVALDFALANSDRIRTLTLIEPPALWVLPDHGRHDDDVRRLESLTTTIGDDVSEEELAEFVTIVGLVPPGARATELSQWSTWMRHRRSLRNTFAPLQHDDDIERLASFDRPVLLVTGSGTAPFLREIVEILTERFPHARLVELPAGHAPQLVSIARFLDELTAFQAAELR